jgi:hypothetical protein
MVNQFCLVNRSLRCLNQPQSDRGDQREVLLYLGLDRDLRCRKIVDLWEARLSRVSKTSNNSLATDNAKYTIKCF